MSSLGMLLCALRGERGDIIIIIIINNHYIIIYHIILYTMCIILYYYWPWTNCYSTWNDVFPKLAFQSQISLARLCPWRQGKSLDYSQSKSKWGFRWSRRWEMANQVILKWRAQISTCTFWEETLSAPPFWWRVISKPPCWRDDFGHGSVQVGAHFVHSRLQAKLVQASFRILVSWAQMISSSWHNRRQQWPRKVGV